MMISSRNFVPLLALLAAVPAFSPARAAPLVEAAPGVAGVAHGGPAAAVGLAAPAFLAPSVPALSAPALDALPPTLPPSAPLAAHLEALRALPGAVAVDVSPAVPFGGADVRVVFADLASLRAGRDAMADRVEYRSRLVAGRERMARALGLPQDAPIEGLVAGYARLLERMDGVRRVLTGVYEHGDAYFDLTADARAQALAPIERDRHPFQVGGQAELKGAPGHALRLEVEEKARRAHIARLERSYRRRLRAIPGVVKVERKVRYSDFGDPPIVEFIPVFESHTALGAARDRGLLPDSFPTVDEYLWDVGWYSVRPQVR
jgi:hypothetical protein